MVGICNYAFINSTLIQFKWFFIGGFLIILHFSTKVKDFCEVIPLNFLMMTLKFELHRGKKYGLKSSKFELVMDLEILHQKIYTWKFRIKLMIASNLQSLIIPLSIFFYTH